jgi:hypothetical protein
MGSKYNGKGADPFSVTGKFFGRGPIRDLLGPDIARAFSEVMGKFPYVRKGSKGNGKWQKGGLIKGKPKLTKRGC